MSLKLVYLVIAVGTAVSMAIVFNSVMYFVYTLKVPFLEQYRCNPDVPMFLLRNLGLGNKILRNGGRFV